SRKETVLGYVTPTLGTAKIFVPHQGFITEIYVQEGHAIEAGMPLLTVSTAQVAANGEDVNATVLQILSLQRDVNNQQVAAEERRSATERDRLVALIKGTETELSHLETQRTV